MPPMNATHPSNPHSVRKFQAALVAVAFLLSATAAPGDVGRLGDAGAAISHDFIGARKCKSCHGKELMGDQNSTWLKGPHAHGFTTLTSSESQEIARAQGLAGEASEAPECLACHVTAFGVPPERIWKPLKASEGVQCESCHGPGRDYRKKKIMADLEEARSKGLWDPDSERGICLRCHNEASPTFDPQRYTLADGSSTGFDYEQAAARIAHPIPEHVKGHYIELRKKQKEEEERQKQAQ